MLQKAFLLISGLIALYAFQQGDEIEIQGEPVKDIKPCRDWYIEHQGNILSNCEVGANCNFFFLQYNVIMEMNGLAVSRLNQGICHMNHSADFSYVFCMIIWRNRKLVNFPRLFLIHMGFRKVMMASIFP